MRQIIYVSTAINLAATDPDAILAVSRRNNRRDGITGLLYSDGKRFLQVVEGKEDPIAATVDRIEKDARHRAIVILSDRTIAAPEFGEWSMAHRFPGSDGDAFVDRVAALVSATSPALRATFASFAALRRAA